MCAVFLSNIFGVYSQKINPVGVLSPNAASLGLYGEIPVSYYTGTPEISIPLYDIEVKDFKMPLSLNYHAAGVYADQRPGWKGLGWSLFLFLIITENSI